MRSLCLVLISLALVVSAIHAPNALAAQPTPDVPRTELGIEADYWILDGGTASAQETALWGAAIRFGVRPSVEHPRTLLEVGAFYAPEDRDDLDPGIAGFQLGVAVSARHPSRRPGSNLSLSLGYAALHYDADALEEAASECAGHEGCLFEGIMYSTGWRSAIYGGVALQFLLTPALSLRIGVDLVAPVGSGGGSSSGNHLRFGFGAAWMR